MANIVFREGSGVTDSVFGKSQNPIKFFLEQRAEAFQQESVLPKIFSMEKSTHFAEKFTAMTGMDEFEPSKESGAYPTTGMQESYSKTIEAVTWKNQFVVSKEMVEDSQLINFQQKPQGFITSYYRTREKHGAALIGAAIKKQTSLTFGGMNFDTTSADKICQFSTAHPSVTGKGNQSNLFADAFSNDALMAAEERMQNFTDDNGNILTLAPDTILIPNIYSLKKAVFAAIGADKDPATANNGFNYNFGRWTVIVWAQLNPFITANTSPWILADSDYNTQYKGAVWIDRLPLEVTSGIAENDDNIWKGRARFSAGFNDWRSMACGGVSGGTTMIST